MILEYQDILIIFHTSSVLADKSVLDNSIQSKTYLTILFLKSTRKENEKYGG